MENKKKERPTSPHLGIYRPQITSILSIFHRLTGVALFFALSLLVWWFNLFVYSSFCTCFLFLAECWIFKFLALCFSFAYFYHLCNGIRHLFWDLGLCFSVRVVTLTGIAVIFFSLIFTTPVWFYIYG